MLFIDAFPSGRPINAPAAFLLSSFVACCVCVPARAADLCLTLPQARAAHPGKYLSYRVNGAQKCWNDHGHRLSVVKHRGLSQTPSVPASRQTVIWPVLASSDAPGHVDATLLIAEPASRWPLLIDIDDDAPPQCCWPPLDEPPFAERWFALPSNWYAQEIRR